MSFKTEKRLKATAEYLSSVLQPAKLTLPFETWWRLHQHPYRNMLFTVTMDQHMGEGSRRYEDVDYVLSFDYATEDVPACNLRRALTNLSPRFKLIPEGPNLTLNTEGHIPIRWLLMLEDFYWGFSNDQVRTEEHPAIPWESLLDELPDNTYKDLLASTLQKPNKAFSVMNPDPSSPLEQYWRTGNGAALGDAWSPQTKATINQCQNFLSLEGKTYSVAFAAEGGLEIPYHRFNKEWVMFEFRTMVEPDVFAICTECRGVNRYSNAREVTVEELAVMMEAFRYLGVPVIEC